MLILDNLCKNCKYCEKFNDKIICSFEVHNHSGSPEELPESRTCKDFALNYDVVNETCYLNKNT